MRCLIRKKGVELLSFLSEVTANFWVRSNVRKNLKLKKKTQKDSNVANYDMKDHNVIVGLFYNGSSVSV